MRVLVTDDSYYSSLGIVRSLGRKGIEIAVLADNSKRLASFSRYCSAKYQVPPSSEDTFFPSVMDVLQRNPVDLIIPVGYETTAALARHKEELGLLTKLEIPDYEKIEAAADKLNANALARRLDVPAPRTLSPTTLDEATELSRELRYPVVIKRRCETPRLPVVYANSPSELLRLLRNFYEHKDGQSALLPLVQEFIPGFGCGFFAIYQKGVCKRIFMHRRVRETPPSGGVSCCASSFYDSRLKEYGTRILDRLEWHGVAMVEFRYDEREGDYKLMEINPKFWGSLDLALAAGVDFPYYLCQLAQGQMLDYSDEFNRSLRYHWPLLELQHLVMRPASVGAMIADFLNPRVKSNICIQDLQPNLLEPFSRMRGQILHRVRQSQGRYTAYPALEK